MKHPPQPYLYLLRPLPVRTAAGNSEERTAQIDRIQDRLDRLRRFSAQVVAEVAAMTLELETLSQNESPASTPPTKESS